MRKVVIVGAGPAGLMVAQVLCQCAGLSIHMFDANKAIARKFLVAGHGGFNLTNTKTLSEFVKYYNHPIIQKAVSQFSNEQTVEWLSQIGIETFIGSSGKVFPKVGIKPIHVLSKWVAYLEERGVQIATDHQLIDFDGKMAQFQTKNGKCEVEYDALVFALGGASWKTTGSTGEWCSLLQKKHIDVLPFEASNAGIVLQNWNKDLGGGVLKNIEVSIGNQQQFGEIELTEYGCEGSPIYALSNQVRCGSTELIINLKPSVSKEQLNRRFVAFNGSKSDFLRQIKIPKSGINLIKHFLSKEAFLNDATFLDSLHQLILPIDSLRPIDEAISTVGGVAMQEIDDWFELQQMPNHFSIGEMLDWDAPTGGYLLQACFASGYVAGKCIQNRFSS